MLDTLRDFVRRLSASKEEVHFSADDSRLAVAALLVHSMAVDGKVTDEERAKVADVLSRKFGLKGGDLELLVEDAVAAEQEAVDLYRFTSVLKRQMGEEERIRVVEDLWEIVFADGKSHEFEENLVWRVAELLGVHRQDRIAGKMRAAQNKSAGSPGPG